VPTSVLSSDQVVRIGNHWVAVNFVLLKIMAMYFCHKKQRKQWPNGRKFAHLVTLPMAPTTLPQKLISVQWFEKKNPRNFGFQAFGCLHTYVHTCLFAG
jgi:hypothetical protein